MTPGCLRERMKPRTPRSWGVDVARWPAARQIPSRAQVGAVFVGATELAQRAELGGGSSSRLLLLLNG